MITSKQHFDTIAREYDYWKEKNSYYYTNLVALYKSLIGAHARVLEIGCGTGDVLSKLSPREGKGIDVSVEMIQIAIKKHGKEKNLSFEQHDIFSSKEIFRYPHVFLADVLEHVDDLSSFMSVLGERLSKGTLVSISVANPLWEPVLMVAEKFKMKMPEGPHKRLSIKKNEHIFTKSGFEIVKKDFRLLVPKKIWFSDAINKTFFTFPLISRLGFIVFWQLKKI